MNHRRLLYSTFLVFYRTPGLEFNSYDIWASFYYGKREMNFKIFVFDSKSQHLIGDNLPKNVLFLFEFLFLQN